MFDKVIFDRRHARLLIVLLGLLSLLAACLSPVRTLPTPTPWPTPTIATKTTYTVQRGTLMDEIQLNGEVAPLVWEALSFRTEGALGALYKLEEDSITKGDLLADLEMPDLLEAIEQAQVALEQAKDTQAGSERQHNFALKRAELEVRKAELLLESVRKGGDETAIQLQEIELDLAQLAFEEVKANVDPTLERTVTNAQLTVDALQRQIEDRQLRAPFDGVLIALGIGLEGIRSAGPRPQPHTPIPAYAPLLVVAQPAPLLIVVPKDAARISELQIGQPVTISHYLARDQPFAGEVSALPVLNSGPITKPGFQDSLQIAIGTEHPPLKIGDFVQVRVLLAVHADTLILPDAAVRRFAGRTFVITQEGDREKRIDITTGLQVAGQVEIVEGLPEGAVVIGQ